MYIEKINVKNFTVFENLEIDFCRGINILIGENGTGKTHLMKLMYAPLAKRNSRSMVFWEDVFTHNTGVQTVPDYFRRNKHQKFFIKILFNRDKPYENKDGILSQKFYDVSTVFIPAVEMLSHSKGFLALERERSIPFDRTLIDIIAKAELGESKKVSDLNKNILKTLSDVIDGKVIYENDTFFILKKNGLKVEFSMEAEGIRKIGLLWKLIRNGIINRDSILFWDEPEANINPQLIPQIVKILLELQRNGVQIFLATHDYNLAKYFEVLSKDNDEVVYYSLYKTDNGVQCAKAQIYREIYNNAIEDANERLYNDILDKAAQEAEDE
ncbi:AAA family ATPase [Clostridium kluyveri]|uniref:AAA family ATPase n=1 Tax=Clostridium kluyveri TaxID=1534 RepID=A0A1L5F953_CLOKL|nr:AAA family ATPase [Clostridium kluyveri]APM39558.1 hypothetical protein BS101_12800 [Clostridium kluyveri]